MCIALYSARVTIVNNNSDENSSKGLTSSTHAVILYDIFSVDDCNDIDCTNETKFDETTLYNKQHSNNNVEDIEYQRLSTTQIVILCMQHVQILAVICGIMLE